MVVMPFSSLNDPTQMERAQTALEEVWAEIESRGLGYHGTLEGERIRVAHIVVGLLSQSVADADLVRLAVVRFDELNG